MYDMNETVYEHIKGSDTVTISAAERWSVAMIKKLSARYPDQVQILHENSDGSLLACVPFEWMRIKPKRRTASDV